MEGEPAVRRLVVVRGTVQGVGFRPWTVRWATRLGLSGHVRNVGADVVAEVQGQARDVAALLEAMRASPPPLALVREVDVSDIAAIEGAPPGFEVRASESRTAAAVAVPADVATCDACLAEVDDPADRRYGYPFTNCVDCGPRYTIIRSLPYDRSATTMAGFVMCDECRTEYEDPTDRRFHAEPVACGACGPRLTWEGPEIGGPPLAEAVNCLVSGGIVAVKGVGGYHLAVRADDEAAVARLRDRKKRDEKPFAVMVGSLAEARALVGLSDAAEAELTSGRRPIVLAPRRDATRVAPAVAPGSADLGVLLPYSPLHHLLLRGAAQPLVMTSGNRTDEPIAQTAEAARVQLTEIADGFLHHDRPIEVRCDDSVVRAARGTTQVVRRSRGFAPEALALPFVSKIDVLAVGAELKSTVALGSGGSVIASHHLGDLEHLAAYAAFEQAVGHLRSLTGTEPVVIAHDLHPEYLSTKWAMEQELELFGVQHHHAHVASCLVDHGRDGPVIGLAFDGLGFGPDGTLWGGEVLLADLRGAERLAHLRPVPLPGGAAAIRQPWRMALVWAAAAAGEQAAAAVGPQLDPQWRELLALSRSGAAPTTSSAGRLFDAVAALAGGRKTISYEGQAAVEFEAAARAWAEVSPAADTNADAWEGEPGEGPWVLDPSPLVRAALDARATGEPLGAISHVFHRRLAEGLVRVSVRLARREGVAAVALTGGVFQNMVLTELVAEGLAASGLEPLVHRRVPPNDGGISIGQVAIAAATLGRVAG